jgi:hypothetical protein
MQAEEGRGIIPATSNPRIGGSNPSGRTRNRKSARCTTSATTDELASIRRIIAALLRKATATSFPHEATACRVKVEPLRAKYRQ